MESLPSAHSPAALVAVPEEALPLWLLLSQGLSLGLSLLRLGLRLWCLRLLRLVLLIQKSSFDTLVKVDNSPAQPISGCYC
jgi:hypothetical protein